ncbi:MAG: hypothetical protein HFG38_01950 [Eubacterium sp.]|nr:hypothetical protein [Eubacterium sp.]
MRNEATRSGAGIPNEGGLGKLRSSGAKRQRRLYSTDRSEAETSPVFVKMRRKGGILCISRQRV